jgi:nucleoid-associated protein YgaU
LAEWFYGSPLKWPKIYEANRKVIVDPDYIYIGQKIAIPPAA